MKLTRDSPRNDTMAQWQPSDHRDAKVIGELFAHFGADRFTVQSTRTGVPVVWLARELLLDVMGFLRKLPSPFVMLYDLSATDERLRSHRDGLPQSDFTVFYHLISIDRNSDLMLKVPLLESDLHLPTLTGHFPNANWYEREVWDLMGITFDGHPHLTRIMMPKSWQGHPLRKDYPARATEFDPFMLDAAKQDMEQENLLFKPEEWGLARGNEHEDYMFLNLGPNHPSAHGAFRLVLQLDGEEIRNCVPDIGYHHRGAEKMGERQSWHSYIPYTDRVEYLGGVMNNLPYVLAVEKLAGIKVPQRVDMIRVMMAELFRIQSHLLFLGTYIQDVGAMTPVFFTFTDRQKIYTIIEAITGARMHPAWFRIGGVAHDLPKGWQRLVQEHLLSWLPKRLMDYEKAAMRNSILRGRTIGVSAYTTEQALAWGTTGAGLRATGLNFDVRKWRPYSGYDQFDFEVPVGSNGDAYDRATVRIEEIRQSMSIIEQCMKNMPEGPFKADHPLTTPPPKDRTLQDIETLINSLEGRRANPRAKPPFPAVSGVWGKPTCVNNVETLCNVPAIIGQGVTWYQGLALPGSEDHGTKLMGFSGKVNNPGVWELPFGITARELFEEYAGGMKPGYRLKAWQPGGAGTGFLLPEHLDARMHAAGIGKVGTRMGTGLAMAVDDSINMVSLLRNMEEFFARESCGWCTPCRDGLPWSVKLLRALEHREGQSGDLATLEQLCNFLGPGKTFCAHAPGAVEPLASALKYFRSEFEAGIKGDGDNSKKFKGIQPNLLGERW